MSYNSLFGLGSHSEDANLEAHFLMQDDAASTAVDDRSGNNGDGTLQGGDNTSDISTTGPNNWLTKAFDLDGSADYFTAPNSALDIAGDISIVGFARPDGIGTESLHLLGAYNTGGSFAGYAVRQGPSSFIDRAEFWNGSSWARSNASMFAAATWVHIGATNDNSNTRFYKNGAAHSAPAHGNPNSWTGTKAFGARSSGDTFFAGHLAGWAIFSRQLSAAEVGEHYNGPEPVNSVAPAISGTETEGETLTATSGTWGLPSPFAAGSNGTITYAYQWTRSDDASGTNEADISGATSSTYTLVAADVGKFIRCRIAASNTGGNDSAADTNSDMSGAIAAAGGAATPRRINQRFLATGSYQAAQLQV